MAGSGTEGFKNWIARLQSPATVFPGPPDPTNVAILLSLMATTTVLVAETVRPENLLESWGGGLELATFVEHRFQKVGDILYIPWFLDFQRAGSLQLKLRSGTRALKVDYFDNLLLVRPILFQFEDGKNIVDTSSMFVIDEIDRKVPTERIRQIPWPPISSQWICNCIFTQLPNGTTEIYSIPTKAGSERKLISVEEEGQQIILHVSADLKRMLHDAIAETLKPTSVNV
jgi:hypothetical protein